MVLHGGSTVVDHLCSRKPTSHVVRITDDVVGSGDEVGCCCGGFGEGVGVLANRVGCSVLRRLSWWRSSVGEERLENEWLDDLVDHYGV